MTSQQILQADLLDILFDKRNKMYGAYSLRKGYNAQLLKAVGATTLLVCAALYFVQPSNQEIKGKGPNKEYNVSTIVIPKEEKIEVKKPEVQKQKEKASVVKDVKQEKLIENIVAVERPVDPVATQNELNDAIVGTEKSEGAVQTGIQEPPLPIAITGVDGHEKPAQKEVVLVSRQPQFPGGTEAWMNFLNKHLRASDDLEAGERRTVQIRFWVDEQGSLANFQVVQSGGSAFDDEVMRVLRKMPKWMPALQNGKPIAVSFTQPVTFAAE